MPKRALAATLFSVIFVFNGAAGTARVELKCRDGSKCQIDGALVLQSVADSSVSRTIVLHANSAVISEPSGSEWDVELDSKGYWALPQRLAIPENAVERRHRVDVWRTGIVRVTVKGADSPVPGVRLVVASPPDPRTPPDMPRGTSFECTSVNAERWDCSVAATLLDLAVRAEGYAPHYRWDTSVSPGEVLDLGTVVLKRGASLVAWLNSDVTKRLDRPVRAYLRHHAAAGASATAARLAAPVAEGTFSKKGVVQLSPLAPGKYLFETRADGFVPVRIPVEVFEGRESTIRRSIDLSPSLSIRVRLDPPLAPGESPWRVELWRRVDFGSGSESAGSGVASREGIFEADDQFEGPVRVVVKDQRQNVLANRELLVVAGIPEHLVSVEVVPIFGKVTIDDEALPAATLVFGGISGAVKVTTATNEEGEYRVSLPRRGKWLVDVVASSAAVAATTDVTVEEDKVDIELPATEISGWVTDPNGARLQRRRSCCSPRAGLSGE
jgi:hypothetical protein